MLPGQAIMEELLRAYFHYVHPLLPLLDSDHFLDAIHGKTGSTISLMLFQAVMFAGATFVDLALLNSMGFNSHDDGRRALFKRVKLLYELDTDLDPLTMIQVLLLMTYWYGQQNDTKGRFYWLRIARSLALDIGLDRDGRPSTSNSQDPFRRRLWYCYIVRDTLLSVTERRSGGLTDSRLDIHALRPEDFQEPGSGEAVNQYYIPAQKIEASTAIRLWFQKVKLCLIVQRILNLQYELSGLRRVHSTETFFVLVPRKSSSAADEAVFRDQELHEWRSETTSIPGLFFGRDHRCNGRLLALHFSTLEMLYCTAVSMVHRPQLLLDRPKESAAGALQAFSALALRSAARRISEIGRHLQEAALVQFMPPIVVGALIISSIQHLKDALSMDTELRSTGHLYLNLTLDAFAALKDMYNSVDCALGFIERVRSGKLPYHSFEWENSAESVPRPGEAAASEAILGEYSRATNNERVALSHDRPHSGGDYTANVMAFAPSSNIDAISELLLYAPYDASQNEWASMDWVQPEGPVF